MDHARAKVLVARAIALLVAVLLLVDWWTSRSPSPPDRLLSKLFWYGALAWISLAFGPWQRLARRLQWWPGNDPQNLYGLAAVVAAIVGAMGLMTAVIVVPCCILLAVKRTLSVRWLAASVIGSAAGVLGTWASPRLQLRALQHDQMREG
ncbi:MAG TPA: hypothetical protein VKM54_27680 [Myxococcota bacterium]|nr:hypothetical protein [Myxococcota bacterium]